MSQFRRRASTLVPAVVATVAIASCVLLSACLGSGDDASDEPNAGEFRTLALLAGPAERGGAGNRDGLGSLVRLSFPAGLALAGDGSLWLSQRDGKIKRISSNGEVRTVHDLQTQPPRTAANGQLVTYTDSGAVAAGPAGEVYMAVSQVSFPAAPAPGETVAASDARWAVLRVMGDGRADVFALPSAEGVGQQATALAVNGRGELFIADTFSCTIWRADGKGDAVLVHSNAPHGDGMPCVGFDSLTHGITRLTFDPQDRLVYSSSRGELRRLETDGSVSLIGAGARGGFDCGALAYAPNGNLIVTDGSSQVYLASPDQDASAWVGKAFERGWFDGSAEDARFGKTCGVAVNAAGDVFVADQEGHTVRRISRTGVVSTLAGLALQEGLRDGQGEQARFGSFVSLSASRDGAIWVADASNYVLRRVDRAGRVTTALGNHAAGLFKATDGPLSRATLGFPTAVAEAADGTLWIADGSSVRRLGTDGILNTHSAYPGGFPLALAPDSAGNLLVLSGDQGFPLEDGASVVSYFGLSRYASQGPLDAAPLVLETRLPAELAQQVMGRLPAGMCLARSGELYFSLGHAVMRRGSDGAVTVHAGAAAIAGSSDGPAADARFDQPAGLACGEDGSIFVADPGNHTVRRIDAQRIVSTVLGRPGQQGNGLGSAPGMLDTPRSLALVAGGLVVNSGLGLVIARY